MTNVLDGLREKFKFMLMRIDKARRREMAARRKTNDAIERTKNAEKKSFYLRHKLDALSDKLFIYGIRVERKSMNVNMCKNKTQMDENKCNEKNEKVEKLQNDLSTLERLQLQYKNDLSVLLSKREVMIQRLEEIEKSTEKSNQYVKILESRLKKFHEAFEVKKMRRELANQRQTSRAQVLIQLRRYLEFAKTRKSRDEKKMGGLVKIIKEIAVNLEVQERVTLQSRKEIQRLVRSKRKYSTC